MICILNLYKLILLLDYTTTQPTNIQTDHNNDQPILHSTIDKAAAVPGKLIPPTHTKNNLLYFKATSKAAVINCYPLVEGSTRKRRVAAAKADDFIKKMKLSESILEDTDYVEVLCVPGVEYS